MHPRREGGYVEHLRGCSMRRRPTRAMHEMAPFRCMLMGRRERSRTPKPQNPPGSGIVGQQSDKAGNRETRDRAVGSLGHLEVVIQA